MLSAIFGVFSEAFTWLIGALNSVVGLFWNATDSELTFFGVLAIVALGISIFMLLMNVVKDFLHFRG